MNTTVRNKLSLKKRFSRIGVIFFIITVLGYTYIYNPYDTNMFLCYLKVKFGFSCPTCGLSRSFYEIAHLNFPDSFSLHFIGPLIFIFLLLVLFRYLIEIISGKEFLLRINKFSFRKLLIVFASLWVVFIIVRFFDELIFHSIFN